jgi:E3 ubiquitin-protein ligase UBR4
LGEAFAEKKEFDAKAEVVINGKSIGAETKLTCAQMRQMQPVSLQKMDVEQVEVQPTGRIGFSSSDASGDEAEELQTALRMSLEENTNGEPDVVIGHQSYEDFVGHLFSSTVELVANVLKRDRCALLIDPLIRLLLDFVQLSRGVAKNDRAKRLGKELSHGISYLLKTGSSQSNQKMSQDKILTLVTCLRAFSNLLTPEADSQYYLAGSQLDDRAEESRSAKQKEKTDPNFVCQEHGIPAVRRRCAKGVHKDRRFYVCGMERGHRCKYFFWADEVEMGAKPTTVEKPFTKTTFHDVVQGYFWNHSVSGISLHARLCRLLEEEIFDGEADFGATSTRASTTSSGKENENVPLNSYYNAKQKMADFSDGVFCCREKLQDIASGKYYLKTEREGGSRELSVPVRDPGDRDVQLLEASLDLLLLIADHQTEGISRWLSLLCEINVSTGKRSLQLIAERVLKGLCGGKQALYHSVRDHFAFWFQLKKLYRYSSQLMEAALVVKEKARNCRADWATSEKITWTNLAAGDLIGTNELISEDEYSQLSSKMIRKVLNELLAMIKNQGGSWRRFCGLRSLPQSHRDLKKSGRDLAVSEGEHHLSASSPIIALFWIACSLSGSNQGRILKLVDFALTTWKERTSSQIKSSESSATMEGDANEEGEIIPISQESTIPEEILLIGDKKLNVDGIVAFSMSLVYSGRTIELRRPAFNIALKLCLRLSPADQGLVFQRLVSSPFENIGKMGKTAVEFLNLLQALCCSMARSVPVTEAADLVMTCFEQQMDAVRYDRSNNEWAVLESLSGTSIVKKRFDLSSCHHCQKSHHHRTKESSEKLRSSRAGRSGNQSGSSSTPQNRASPNIQRKWHCDQVSAYSRGRLDSSKNSFTSNEFCSFYMLKYRLSVSDIHLSVNDPRGRYVKTVNIYISPRPVSDITILKSEDYSDKWQKCATLTLPRKPSRVNVCLSQPIVAANLKIEFAKFYERPGGSKASDGSMLVHCPRCTRVVTNAHGVCGNCGEVAFQCRKCRHINYDRLDAFLCVECGYCASGSFSFELTAGVASNAIAITDDEDHNRGSSMLGAATSIHDELRNALRESISTLTVKKRSGAKKDETDSVFNAAMKRAFLGLPPVHNTSQARKNNLDLVEKAGSVVKFVARPSSSHSTSRGSNSIDRTRSLLRLARQIRSESGANSDRSRSSSDLIIRHLGRGLAIDHMEDENDLIGLLGGGASLNAEDSLSRVMARNRIGESGGSSGQGAQTGEDECSQKKEKTGKEAMEECQRLHMLMREAERESFELTQKIQAWKLLDGGSITYTGLDATPGITFTPSHCSSCAVPIAHQLLALWLKIFHVDPNIRIDHEFLCTLLEDVPGTGKGFSDCKRLVVREIATKSDNGAKLVLVELRKRLNATKDVACAEILGKIMEVEDFGMAEEYCKLAIEVLGQSF